MQPFVSITFPRLGLSTGKTKVTTEANGFTGTACQTATEAINNALGIMLTNEAKPELYQTDGELNYLSGSDG